LRQLDAWKSSYAPSEALSRCCSAQSLDAKAFMSL